MCRIAWWRGNGTVSMPLVNGAIVNYVDSTYNIAVNV